MGELLDRFHVVRQPTGWGLVQGTPSNSAPYDSSKDDTSGPPVITGELADLGFWRAIRAAHFIWISSGFKRYWRRGDPREIEF